ncbi:tetratricopeptide repeat protein [Sinimarinibacterium sp. CAU 1509]|uniref:serine/threonine-protein kinase n=1 Tax=Sinimarinibacterium sp. CAU 1509 TaxID=2562283 RepID=UPI0010AD2D5B|nr:serine/threonine-protein kinase [Sinimarinibacterium sp. CAU 1509]TJY59450.1 tetratricopeptide repeat protein [Sinimarinibacterium sp. CAU 1509]
MSSSTPPPPAATAWDRVWPWFDAALEQPAEIRDAWIAQHAIDPELLNSLHELLRGHEAAERADQERSADTSATDPLLPPGTRIDAWRVERLIGSGGMGEVYAVQRDDGAYAQRAALKLLTRIDSREDTRRFERERGILARLEHPGIARLLDGGVHQQRPYAVLEFVEGVSITQFAAHLDLQARIGLLLQVCDAVAAAHRSFIVHRDLKPGNVLVNSQGQIKLLDFGIAKLTGAVDVRTDLTQVLALSPDYCAPEQLENGPITTATDVYALGVMLFELLTGTRPWPATGTAVTRAIERLRQPDAPAPSRVAPAAQSRALRGDLDAIVLKAMRPDPAARYPTVEALSDDLQNYLCGRPVRARGNARSYVMLRTLRRYRWWATAGGAVFASLALGLAGVTWQAREARLERDIARAEADRADAVRQYLVYMFRTAGESESEQPVTAKAVLDDATKRLQAEYADAPARAADMMQALGELYFLMNDYEGGIPLLQRMLELADDQTDPNVLARVRLDLGQMYYRSGDADAAEPLLQQAQTFWNQNPQRYRGELASSFQLQAQLQRARGDLEGAIATLESAAPQVDATLGRDHLESGVLHNNLGLLYFHAGRLDDADREFAYAWSVWEARRNTRGGDALNTLNNWAAVASRRGELDHAERLYRQALETRRMLLAPSAALAALLSNYGKLMLQKGDPGAALPLLEEAVELAQRYAGDKSPHLIAALSGLGDAYTRIGRLDQANATLNRAQELALSATGPAHPLALMVGVAQVRLDAARGDTAAAATRLDQVEQGFTALGPAGRPYVQQVQQLRSSLNLPDAAGI